jgi:hypothetical protein
MRTYIITAKFYESGWGHPGDLVTFKVYADSMKEARAAARRKCDDYQLRFVNVKTCKP